MNSFVAGIDLGEKESSTTYMAPDGDIREQFKFPITAEGYREMISWKNSGNFTPIV